jgi:hypothetical protein
LTFSFKRRRKEEWEGKKKGREGGRKEGKKEEEGKRKDHFDFYFCI